MYVDVRVGRPEQRNNPWPKYSSYVSVFAVWLRVKSQRCFGSAISIFMHSTNKITFSRVSLAACGLTVKMTRLIFLPCGIVFLFQRLNIQKNDQGPEAEVVQSMQCSGVQLCALTFTRPKLNDILYDTILQLYFLFHSSNRLKRNTNKLPQYLEIRLQLSVIFYLRLFFFFKVLISKQH